MRNQRIFRALSLISLSGLGLALPACSSDKNEPATTAVFAADSRGIDMSCGGFFDGSMEFRATREQLTDSDLALLSHLVLIDAKDQCPTDTMSCSVSVTGGDGIVTTYRSTALDGACDQPGKVIAFDSLAPFMATLPCLFAKRGTGTTADGGALVPSVPPDVRCLNGLFTGGAGTINRALVVGDSGVAHHVELDRCDNQYRSPAQLHLTLLAPDGVTPLAQGMPVSDPGPDQACWRLDYTFSAAGSYLMNVAVDQGFQPGDFYFRFY